MFKRPDLSRYAFWLLLLITLTSAGVRRAAREMVDHAFQGLSGREIEVLALVAQGKTNAEIAQVLHLSEKTGGNHVSPAGQREQEKRPQNHPVNNRPNAERVSGVRLHHRHEPYHNEIKLAANLVVDASGRDSHAPHWLASLGYTPPRESVVNSFGGYASRLYRFPSGFTRSWKTLSVRPTPPWATRGGAFPI